MVIGGINNINYKRLIKVGKYLNIKFYLDNLKLKPETAIKKFK